MCAGVWLGCVLAFAACRSLDGAAPPPATSAPSNAAADASTTEDLAWLPDGSRIVVGGRWLLDPANGRFSPLYCTQAAIAYACQNKALAFSPTGKQWLVFDGMTVAFGPLGGPVGAGIVIPRWLHARPDLTADDLVNVVFWLSERSIFFQQFDRAEPFAPVCRVLDTRTGAWRCPRGGCLSGDFLHLVQVQQGPDGWLLLYSEAEGYEALNLVRYDPANGQTDPGIPGLALEGPGPIAARFAGDGSRVDVITRCPLESAQPPLCSLIPAEAPTRLYAWSTTGGGLRLQRADLPSGTVLDPAGKRFAWPRGASVCIGDPRQDQPHCISLPAP
ncbi:MAG: hypothetical protein U1F68_05415 [Gammaproteobacteria bacterium]